MRSCSFIHTYALFSGFKIPSAFSCSQSSTFEIANLFQPCSAQASAFPILPAIFNLVLLRSPSPQDYVGCFESLSAIYYPFIAFRAVSLSNISPWCIYLPSWTSWYYYTLSRSLVFGRTAWDLALAVLGVIPTFRQLPSSLIYLSPISFFTLLGSLYQHPFWRPLVLRLLLWGFFLVRPLVIKSAPAKTNKNTQPTHIVPQYSINTYNISVLYQHIQYLSTQSSYPVPQ